MLWRRIYFLVFCLFPKTAHITWHGYIFHLQRQKQYWTKSFTCCCLFGSPFYAFHFHCYKGSCDLTGTTHEIRVSLVPQSVKNLPAMQETRVRFLSWEDPLEKEMATHSSILARRISWSGKPGGLQSKGVSRVGHDLATTPPPVKSRKIVPFQGQLISKQFHLQP